MEISIVIPAYNEEDGISRTITSVRKVMDNLGNKYEIIVVDDGSTDSTFSFARESGARVIRHPHNLGYGASLKTGFRNSNGEIIIELDADGTYPPEEIPHLLSVVKDFDLVIGARTGSKVTMPILRRIGNTIIRRLATYLVGKKISDPTSGMRVIRKKLTKNFESLTDGFSISATMTMKAIAQGLRVIEVPINYQKRKGKSKLRALESGIKFIMLLIRLSIDYNPEKIFTPLGLAFLFSGLAYILYTIIFLFNVTTAGLLLFTVGIQILAFSLLAGMISRRMK